MKIFEVIWYNEDGYGPIEWVRSIIQAETEEDAEKKAKDKLEPYIQELIEGFEYSEIKDISFLEVLFNEHRTGI